MLEKEKDVQKRSDQPVEQWHRNLSPFAEMDRLFDEVFKRPFFSLMSSRAGAGSDQLFMPVDIFEDGESIVVKAEIPGIKKEDIDVQLTPDSITISGQRSGEEKVERKNYLRVERSHGSFSRRFELPVETMVDKARATFKDGILEVRIPKSEQAQERVTKVTID